MLNWLTRRFSSLTSLLTSPFRAFWRLMRHIFPAQDVTAISGFGDLDYYHKSTARRFWTFILTIAVVVWTAWATYTYVYHSPILERRTEQLADARAQHAQQMSDLNTYFKKYSELNRQINTIDDQLVNGKKLSADAAEKLVKQRVLLWADIDMLSARLNTMFTDGKYAPDFQNYSDLAVDHDILRSENDVITARNKALESTMLTISDADSQLTDGIAKLTHDKTDALQKNMKKISASLASLGLSTSAVAARALATDTTATPFVFNKNADPKYQKLADDIDLWTGLTRAEEMLPIGAPIDNPRITSSFGTREDPIDGQPGAVHKGIDFHGTIGMPLMAVAPGRVIFVGQKTGYGNVVEIDHGLGFTTLYGHLSRFNVKEGDTVKARDVIGFAGSTGRSTGPHLHYEIRYNNAPFNPYNFIKK